MNIKDQLKNRLATVEEALGGDQEDLDNLQKGIISRYEKIIKVVQLANDSRIEITFLDGEILCGDFFYDDKTIILNEEQAEIVANAYNITELD